MKHFFPTRINSSFFWIRLVYLEILRLQACQISKKFSTPGCKIFIHPNVIIQQYKRMWREIRWFNSSLMFLNLVLNQWKIIISRKDSRSYMLQVNTDSSRRGKPERMDSNSLLLLKSCSRHYPQFILKLVTKTFNDANLQGTRNPGRNLFVSFYDR